jgi:hypothetical protein
MVRRKHLELGTQGLISTYNNKDSREELQKVIFTSKKKMEI